MSGALGHIRVLDLTRILAGPWVGQLFADLGAEVIKIERPQGGDDTRAWGPPFLKDEGGRDTVEAAYFLSANRGKKSVTIDISTQEGARIVKELASCADIMLENYKVGGLKRYGLDYESLHAINPRLIYCSITGFGQTGPYKERVGYDFLIQAMGGLMSVTGERDDLPGGGPQKVGVPIADIMAGMYAAVAVLAALAYREQSGEGQYIDMALLDTQVTFLANQNMNYLATGFSPKRMGNAHPNIVPYQTFSTLDGNIILAIGNDSQFKKFCDVAGKPKLSSDKQFVNNSTRLTHRDTLIAIIADCIRQHSSEFWMTELERVGVPCGPINDLEAVFRDPQVIHRGLKISLPHPTVGKIDLIGNPIKFSRTPVNYISPPPLLGQHTHEVLSSILDMTEQEIMQLKARSVI